MKINQTYNIKIQSEKFGTILNESFIDATQFKLFLKMVHGCLELKQDLDFFNGTDFLIHIPFVYLKDGIVTTSIETPIVNPDVTLVDHMKSKIESLVTK